MTSVCAPIELHTLDKAMRRGLGDLVERVTMRAVIDGDGQDLLLRVYLAGLYHGSECAERRRRNISSTTRSTPEDADG